VFFSLKKNKYDATQLFDLQSFLKKSMFHVLSFSRPIGPILIFCLSVGPCLWGQTTPSVRRDTSTQQGGWVYREIVNGDTLYLSTMRVFQVSDRRVFKNDAEREQLRRYRRYARKVYPYALQAIELYNEFKADTEDMNRRERRRYKRGKKKEFKTDFEDELKKLYRQEGYVLIKMIERQIGKDCHGIVAETQGSVKAAYWHNLSKIWGYDLKEGYQVGKDPLLDEVLLDYDFGEAIWRY
jgi:Domain of unknown function (DUF4294)